MTDFKDFDMDETAEGSLVIVVIGRIEVFLVLYVVLVFDVRGIFLLWGFLVLIEFLREERKRSLENNL